MNAIQRLCDDHVFFRERMNHLVVLSTNVEFKNSLPLAKELVKELRKRHKIHLLAETEIFFPAVAAALAERKGETHSDLSHHLQEEHLGVSRNLYALAQEIETTPVSPRWPESARRLETAFVAHMSNEELNLFPLATTILSEKELLKMGQAMSALE